MLIRSMKLVFWLFFASMFSMHSYAIDLNKALSSTYESNPSLKAQRESTKADDEKIMQSVSRWLPSVEAGGQKRVLRKSTDGGVKTKTKGTSKYVAVSQNLFRGGADVASVKAAKASIEQSRSNLVSKEQEILLNAVDVYMKTLQAEEQHKMTEEQLVDSKLLLQSAERRFQAGDATKTDVAEANAALADALSGMISVSGNFEVLKAKFFEVTGLKAHKLIMPMVNVVLPKTLDEAIELSLRNNPEFVATKFNSDVAKYGIAQVRGEKLLPSVDLSYQIQDNRDDNSLTAQGFSSSTLNKQAAVNLKIPLFNGGASWSQYREMKRKSQKSHYDLVGTKQRVITATTEAWRDFESKKSVYKARQEQVKASKTAYTGTKKEEKAGIRSISDVIIARNNYFNSYSKMLNARTEYIVARYKIAAAIGECTAKHLGLDVKLYDPKKNYNIIKMQLIGSYNPD